MKNTKSKFLIFGTLALLSISIFLSKRNLSGSDYKDTIQNESFDYSEYLTLKKKLEDNSEDMHILGLTIIDTAFKKIYLSDLKKNGPVLVFNFLSAGCQVCAEAEIRRLSVIKKKNAKLNIILISDFQTDREFKLFDKWHKSGLEWFNNKGHKLNLPIEKLEIPFYFILDSDGKAKKVFAPLKEFPTDTDIYFTSIPF